MGLVLFWAKKIDVTFPPLSLYGLLKERVGPIEEECEPGTEKDQEDGNLGSDDDDDDDVDMVTPTPSRRSENLPKAFSVLGIKNKGNYGSTTRSAILLLIALTSQRDTSSSVFSPLGVFPPLFPFSISPSISYEAFWLAKIRSFWLRRSIVYIFSLMWFSFLSNF